MFVYITYSDITISSAVAITMPDSPFTDLDDVNITCLVAGNTTVKLVHTGLNDETTTLATMDESLATTSVGSRSTVTTVVQTDGYVQFVVTLTAATCTDVGQYMCVLGDGQNATGQMDDIVG